MAALAARARIPDGIIGGCAAAIVAVMVVAFAMAGFDGYRDGVAFGEANAAARLATFLQFDTELSTRLRAETSGDAVVLASPTNSLTGVAPAGRAVVAVPAEFSSPFVPFEPRARDQQRLFALLIARNRQAFADAAAARGVTHVVLGPQELAAFEERGAFEPLQELSRQGGFAIFAVRQGNRNER
jgi:hypothetical protein